MKTIGVFDSGIGGLSVAHAIEKALPEHRVLFKNDTKNVPYGTKTPQQLRSLVEPILLSMVQEGCNIIVIACNTVTTTLITQLRATLPVPLVGMEPMVKPAANITKTNTIAVFATPTTLASQRYAELKEQYAKDVTVLEPDCGDWSRMIEANHVDKEKIQAICEEVCSQSADVIVLGCTHYHWIDGLIKQVVGSRAQVLQPEEPVIVQVKKILTSSANSAS